LKLFFSQSDFLVFLVQSLEQADHLPENHDSGHIVNVVWDFYFAAEEVRSKLGV
jgi:hypothetical protein